MTIDRTQADDHRLVRLQFATTVVSRDVAAGATYGDIARMFDETTRMRHGNPIAVNVTFKVRAAGRQVGGRKI